MLCYHVRRALRAAYHEAAKQSITARRQAVPSKCMHVHICMTAAKQCAAQPLYWTTPACRHQDQICAVGRIEYLPSLRAQAVS